MRAVYRNPKELATCLKDLVDNYLEYLLSYDDLENKIKKIVDANGDRVYKDGKISLKLYPYLGDERVEIIDKIIKG
ncbi:MULTISPECIES: TIGR04540 family protein [Clostridium]|uniref:TIGR04540 family protein n=1 Tax=Clostridium TaxID=1485 RepID=UPI001897AFD1|nr:MULTISPECIES: TIGR04540 family protein [Clostridium]MCR1952652.1 TIGR04540 family protein [Clostridium sp. DSM 100503]MDI9215464.1 TIGR04540 family protein [Clostridium tertium]